MKVLTVIITRDYVEPACLQAVIDQSYPDHAWLIRGEPPTCADPNPFVRSSKNCAHNREAARTLALASDADYFLFVDSDVVVPPNAVETFLRQIRPARQIVQTGMPNIPFQKHVQGGWYKMKKSPRWVAGCWVADHVFHHYLAPQPSLVRADMVGLGCCFVSRQALSELRFEHGTDKSCRDMDGRRIVLEECCAFGNLASEKGFLMYMNGDVVCEHVDRANGEHFDLAPPPRSAPSHSCVSMQRVTPRTVGGPGDP